MTERARGRSVRAIADRAGVAIGTVPTVQHGLGNPSLATLRRIDRAVKELDGRRQECEQRIRK